MKSLFACFDNLNVGPQEIDEQHKVLVGLRNELHSAISGHRGSAECRGILDRLAEYTRMHFAAEESLMRILDYPDCENHKHEHEMLIGQVVGLQQKPDAGQTAISFELFHFLKAWLTKHILGSDKQCGIYFHSRGIVAVGRQRKPPRRRRASKSFGVSDPMFQHLVARSIFQLEEFFMKRMKRLLALTITSAAFAAPSAFAADGPWMVRVRAVNLDMANKSDAIPALAVPSDAIRASDKTIPEVDISYFITKNIAAELILTVPQKHTVTVTQSAIGLFTAGTFKHLPPTLTLQYHFLPDGQFRPYVGAGVNYTRISSVGLAVPGITTLHLENDSWGGALQVGFDVKLGNNLFLNLDVKNIYINTDIKDGAGTKLSHLKLDPLAIGIGLGWRF